MTEMRRREGWSIRMIGLVSVGPRLAKLVELLASDAPSEVAAAAITRTVRGAGLEWHTLDPFIAAGIMRRGVMLTRR